MILFLQSKNEYILKHYDFFNFKFINIWIFLNLILAYFAWKLHVFNFKFLVLTFWNRVEAFYLFLIFNSFNVIFSKPILAYFGSKLSP